MKRAIELEKTIPQIYGFINKIDDRKKKCLNQFHKLSYEAIAMRLVKALEENRFVQRWNRRGGGGQSGGSRGHSRGGGGFRGRGGALGRDGRGSHNEAGQN